MDNMVGDRLKSRGMNLYLVYCLISVGFIGLFTIDGIVPNGSVEAKKIIVDCNHNGDYSTIQNAVNTASDGDIVIVRSGTYYENIVIDKSITLIGMDRINTIIDGMGDGNTITIKANGVTIDNFTIKNNQLSSSYSGIRGLNINNVSIINNFFTCYKGIGIYLSDVENSEIINNIFEINYCGIFLYKSKSNFLKDNIVLNANCGIKLSYSTFNVVVTNRLIDNELVIEGEDSKHWDTNNIVYAKETTIVDDETRNKLMDSSEEIRFVFFNFIIIILLIILAICYYKPNFIFKKMDKIKRIKNSSLIKNQAFRIDHYKFKYKSKHF
jgi:parallel beta-helix repeat protein